MTILTDSMLTRAIALNEVKDIARSPDQSLGLYLVSICPIVWFAL
ncbi:hypothetical protein [Pseudanabaena sp. UWO311]|nr:hypothetical protein [Pseudanabaena sp. UWO311]